ncbi:hypothetical protein EON77_10895 [bacterium]|nr:MAG: hypothetical protein EON77_10895 [bacterium]
MPVNDAARVLGVIAGHDPRDATSIDARVPDFEAACEGKVHGLRVGLPAEYFVEGLDPEVEATVRAAVATLEAEGCTVVPVSLPHTRFALATYYVLATAEASSNLSRFDGVRFGLRVEPTHDLKAMYGATRDAGFGREVKRRILLGTFVLSEGYFDAYYLKAQRVRTLLRRDFEDAFRACDVLCSPAAPMAAFALGDKIADPLAMYLTDVFTLPASLAGVPAMSVPAGLSSRGLPIGLQLMAPPLREETMFSVAAAFERAAPPHERLPAFAKKYA